MYIYTYTHIYVYTYILTYIYTYNRKARRCIEIRFIHCVFYFSVVNLRPQRHI